MKTNEEYKLLVLKRHGNKYDLENTVYKGMRNHVTAICPKHGNFSIYAYDFAYKRGCPKCGVEERVKNKTCRKPKSEKLTKELFVKKSNEVFNSFYDYSLTDLKNKDEKGRVKIICPVHGEFWQNPYNHIKGYGCEKCGKEKASKKQSYTKESFIEKAKVIHNNKYLYDKVVYRKSHSNVTITCPVHGDFEQKAYSHLEGHGCPKCMAELNRQKLLYDTDMFIKSAKSVHKDKYDYSEVKYRDMRSLVKINCPNGHSFIQMPYKHLQGHGCPICNNSHIEEEIRQFLQVNNIIFEEQKTFDWLKHKNKLRLDFYLPDYNIAIECQGQQHFKDVYFDGKTSLLEENIKRDQIKKNLCEEHGLKIYYYANYEYDFPYFVYTDKEKMLKQIFK